MIFIDIPAILYNQNHIFGVLNHPGHKAGFDLLPSGGFRPKHPPVRWGFPNPPPPHWRRWKRRKRWHHHPTFDKKNPWPAVVDSKKSRAKRKKTKTQTENPWIFFEGWIVFAWIVDGSFIFESWNFCFEVKFRYYERLCKSWVNISFYRSSFTNDLNGNCLKDFWNKQRKERFGNRIIHDPAPDTLAMGLCVVRFFLPGGEGPRSLKVGGWLRW